MSSPHTEGPGAPAMAAIRPGTTPSPGDVDSKTWGVSPVPTGGSGQWPGVQTVLPVRNQMFFTLLL